MINKITQMKMQVLKSHVNIRVHKQRQHRQTQTTST